ncbi:hypothetical protein TRFO_32093 [Tritrichomonas foetus]|uniref:Uncharacterized protein n=1 Tax=Tritrichomonas foetus TaxID=1144522 RepID=A0A1J4JRY6_9EUKA|nr:hypothetical protein TRFO_32093 [Tritrichomonas foetus]|eukprot:OHT01200.1 hypothetical protein TRFO_32093 [Tritrichomonas foetus]
MINDISIRLSPNNKFQIRQLDQNVSDMQKANRLQWARIIQKQSEISARRHKLSEKALIRKKFKEEMKQKYQIYLKKEKEVENYQIKINQIYSEIAKHKKTYSSLLHKIESIQRPDLATLSQSIRERRLRVQLIHDNKISYEKQAKILHASKNRLEKLMKEKQKILLKHKNRELQLLEILKQPIDDLRLELLTVEKIEQYCINNKININEINNDDDSFIVNEEIILKNILNSNEKKKNSIDFLKDAIEILKNAPKSPKQVLQSPKKANSPSKIEYNQERVSQLNDSIDSLMERQKMIDNLENATTSLQIVWADDQKQIENSWMSKMDKVQRLQERSDEVDHLKFDIDEVLEKINQLKEEEMILAMKKSDILKNQVKSKSRLQLIQDEYLIIQQKVEEYAKKKNEIDRHAEKITFKKHEVDSLQKQVQALQEKYHQYRLSVETLENHVNDIKSGNAAQTQMTKPKDRVHFVHLSKELKWKSKTPCSQKAQRINFGPNYNIKQQIKQIITPQSKLNSTKRNDLEEISNNDTFSDEESGKDEFVKIIDDNNNNINEGQNMANKRIDIYRDENDEENVNEINLAESREEIREKHKNNSEDDSEVEIKHQNYSSHHSNIMNRSDKNRKDSKIKSIKTMNETWQQSETEADFSFKDNEIQINTKKECSNLEMSEFVIGSEMKLEHTNENQNHENSSSIQFYEEEENLVIYSKEFQSEEEDYNDVFVEDDVDDGFNQSVLRSLEQFSKKTEVLTEESTCFPTPEHFDDTFHENELYESSKDCSYDHKPDDKEIEDDKFIENSQDIHEEKENLSCTEDHKSSLLNSAESLIEEKATVQPSKIMMMTDLETPNPNRYHRSRSLSDDSDEEFMSLIKEARSAIEMPLFQSKYMKIE